MFLFKDSLAGYSELGEDGIKKNAVICILKNKDRFLLLKRSKEPNKGKYTPVGGKIDPFETPLQAAIRETYEETGIKISEMDYHGILVETSPINYNWICFIYSAEIDFIDPPECNEGELKWIDFSDVLNIPTPKTDWYIYKYLIEEKKFNFSAEYDANVEMQIMRDDLTGKTLFEKLN